MSILDDIKKAGKQVVNVLSNPLGMALPTMLGPLGLLPTPSGQAAPDLIQPGTKAPPPTDYSVKTRAAAAGQAAIGLGYIGSGNAVDILGKSTKRNNYAVQDLLG
jgi:hypothetical protein